MGVRCMSGLRHILRFPHLGINGRGFASAGKGVRLPWEVQPNRAMEQQRSVEEIEEFLLEQEELAELDDGVNSSTGERGGPSGSRKGAEPTRYGDWENKGRASDF